MVRNNISEPEVILYHYYESPYAQRVVHYLQLRGIPYKSCYQPTMLPRPDLKLLNINHRRIPIIAIGRDIYLDSRHIIATLETKFPVIPALEPTPAAPTTHAFNTLLQNFTVDSSIFSHGVTILPLETPMLQDPKWWEDRRNFFPGPPASPKGLEKGRPAALVYLRGAFDTLEGLLSDGRDWIAGTKIPSVADIDGGWPFYWMITGPHLLTKEVFNAQSYPAIYDWVARFKKSLSESKRKHSKPVSVTGEQAVEIIQKSDVVEAKGVADELATFKVGDVVDVRPSDYGTSHGDVGKLVTLDKNEVVIELELGGGKKPIRLHAPRHGFMIRKARLAKL